MSKYYRCLYYSEQNAIAKTVKGSSRILTNNLHCLAVLRNKCAHAARLYGCEMNPPVQFGRNFLKKHPEIINNTLFAYIIMLIRNLSNPTYRKKLIEEVIALVNEYNPAISFNEIGFTENYEHTLNNLI